jgi:hypothetical protein
MKTFVILLTLVLTIGVANRLIDMKNRHPHPVSNGNFAYYVSNDVQVGASFHEIKKLSDDTSVGILGAVMYILDRDGQPISKGFHKIIPTKNGYTAELGSIKYLLDKEGSIKWTSEPLGEEAAQPYHQTHH